MRVDDSTAPLHSSAAVEKCMRVDDSLESTMSKVATAVVIWSNMFEITYFLY